ncbi:MAG: DNA mismatch repair endonuclease MutL [Myxococcales bacterium]|nr:DNA mismatch repair endonuclease MutL [Myxococcales bacterium]
MAPSRIQILPTQIANQIAAGEVVERPASVVKELAENSLDAGARRIEIEIAAGGRSLIRVVDDGDGMTPEEARLSLQRHATSKLQSVEQLFALVTMGFRGEALPSIAAVARLLLVTRGPDTDEGFQLAVDGGVESAAGPIGAPRGTRIEVRDLLHNVPARLKFLKAEATESAHVVDAVVRLALAHPAVHFKLRSEGRTLIDLPPSPSLIERARAALGRRGAGGGAARLHLEVGSEGAVAVEACLGAPSESGTTSRNTVLLVNRRFVRDRGLLQAIALGYGTILERGRYPLAVVHVALPPADVDVNVHPQKSEVRFARPQEVAAAVRHVIAHACARAPWLLEPAGPQGGLGAAAVRVYSLPPETVPRAEERDAGFEEQRQRLRQALGLFGPRDDRKAGRETGTAASDRLPLPLAGEGRGEGPAEIVSRTGFFSSLRYLGQLHGTYLVCQAEGELVLIDQHAAHERVAFERLRTAHRARSIRTQRLLFPHTLDLDEAQSAAASEHGAVLAALGFDIEPFGGQSFAVKAVPAAFFARAARGVPAIAGDALSEAPLGEVLAEILDQLSARGGTEVVADRLDNVFATMACHSVVRAGDVLDDARARALLDSMDGVDFRAHCPHGRPALLRMSLGEIERRFGRT